MARQNDSDHDALITILSPSRDKIAPRNETAAMAKKAPDERPMRTG